MKPKIVVIDDKDHALKQVLHCFPNEERIHFDFLHFDSFKNYKNAIAKQRVFLIFLDFFLDKDLLAGHEVVSRLNSNYLVGFSSHEEASIAIRERGIQVGKFTAATAFAVKKVKDVLDNHALRLVLQSI